MQVVKTFFLFFVCVWFLFIVFMPKSELYYTLESSLAQKEIYFNEKEIDEGMFTLTLHHVSVYVKGVQVGHIKKIQFLTFLFYSSVHIEGIEVDSSLEENIPKEVKQAHLKHTLLHPTKLVLDANGSFGIAEGSINLVKQNIKIYFKKVEQIEMLRAFLKKDGKGWYYERSF